MHLEQGSNTKVTECAYDNGHSSVAQKQWLTLLYEQAESTSKAAFYREKLCDAHFNL